MKTVEITVTDKEANAIIKLANLEGLEPKTYARNIIRTFLKDRLLSWYKSEFDKKNLSELEELFGSPI